MNAKVTKPRKRGKTDWKKVKALSESQIKRAAKNDPDAPLLTKGELKRLKPARTPDVIDIRSIRRKLHLTQEQFARFFGVSKRTIQEWEQHRRTPSPIARNFLTVIEREPRAVQRALTGTDD